MDEDYGFLDGIIYEADKVVVIASSARAEENNIDHAYICQWKNNAWIHWYEEMGILKLCSYVGPNGLTLVEMEPDGIFVIRDTGGWRLEEINGEDGPTSLRQLNDIRVIGEFLYVVGMRRQVFRRKISDVEWRRCDEGVFITSTQQEVAGFLSVDGFSEDDVYAVGYGGEIWHFAQGRWVSVSSPTDLRLESIRCVDDKYAVVVGDEGIILRGRDNRWEIVEQAKSEETFTDVELYKGNVYVSTEVGSLFCLQTNLEAIPYFSNGEVSTGQLHSNEEYLLSIGERHLAIFDGLNWKLMELPQL